MVSVIVPVYNCENTLSRCLDSILNQTFCDFECICINDGSTDGSYRVLEEYRQRDSRIVVQHIDNHGQAFARNLGMSLAQKEYICFVDADDTIHKDYFMKMIHAVEKCHCDLAVCGMERIFVKKASWLERHFVYYQPFENIDIIHMSDDPSIMHTMINAPYCKMIKKEFIEDHSIRFMEGKIYEDLYFTQLMLLYNPSISFISDSLYDYFVYAGSTMTSKSSSVSDMYDIMSELISAYQNKEVLVQYKDELEYLVIHHVAIGTVYRSFMQNQLGLFHEIKKARAFLRQNGFTINNKYVFNSKWFVKMYLLFFFSYL